MRGSRYSPRSDSAFAVALLLIGLAFPTSDAAEFSVILYSGHMLLLCAGLLGFGLVHGRFGSLLQLWNAAFLVVWPLTATLMSPFDDLAVGALLYYFTMACVLSLDMREVRIAPVVEHIVELFTVTMIVTGVAVVAGNTSVTAFLSRHYSFAYPDLVSYMLAQRKPIFTFGSHSIAGFFYFLFFLMHFEAYRLCRRRRSLALAVGCVIVGSFVASVTAALFMVWATLLLAVSGGAHGRAIVAGLVVVMAILAWTYRDMLQDAIVVSNFIASFSERSAGFRGRFSEGAALLSNLEFLRTQPLRPVGVSYSTQIFYGDSGPIEYLTRGSVPLLAAVYSGLGVYLWRGLGSRRHAALLFLAILAFDVGFTVLTYSRFLYVLPFIVIYLNYLSATHRSQNATAPEGAPSPPPSLLGAEFP